MFNFIANLTYWIFACLLHHFVHCKREYFVIVMIWKDLVIYRNRSQVSPCCHGNKGSATKESEPNFRSGFGLCCHLEFWNAFVWWSDGGDKISKAKEKTFFCKTLMFPSQALVVALLGELLLPASVLHVWVFLLIVEAEFHLSWFGPTNNLLFAKCLYNISICALKNYVMSISTIVVIKQPELQRFASAATKKYETSIWRKYGANFFSPH